MPKIDELDYMPKRTLNVFYVLDTSGSMSGNPIQVLNRAMEETMEALKMAAQENSDANIKVSVLTFDSNARWLQSGGPEDIEDFIWSDLSAGGLTNMGEALDELNNCLSTKKFLKSSTGALLPVIIFMTDGFATDEWRESLEEIKKNKLFRQATKIGFAIGEAPDSDMIARIVGNSEAVIRSTEMALFAKMLRFASVSASIIASRSRIAGNSASGRSVVVDALNSAGISKNEVDPGIVYFEEEDVFDNSDVNAEWDDGDDDIWI